jgi:3-hydroxy-9,10-secoandrosta-1,3,5(10)-triene-9,17-dione monooxygenase
MQILTPKRFGGHELTLGTMVEVARILSTACASTGWISSFYMGHNWLHAVFPERSQEEAFRDGPFVLSSGQVAPTAKAVRVAGGFEVSGRQAWSSGIVHARWVFFTAVVTEEGKGPQPWMFCIPREDVEVIDTWFIAGMQGTGSRDAIVEKLFVPDYRAVCSSSLMGGSHPGGTVHANPLYRLPVTTALSFEVMPVLAGALRGAADTFLQQTRNRIASYSGTSVAAKPAAQMRIGRTFALVEAMDVLLNDAVTSVTHGDPNEFSGAMARAQLRMRSALMTKIACDGVNDIIHGAGGDSFREHSPLQRFFRDLNVLRTHGGLDIEPVSEFYGQVILGVDTGGARI